MKKRIYFYSVLVLFIISSLSLFFYNGCKSVTEPDSGGTTNPDQVTVEGLVLDEVSGLPIQNAVIIIKYDSLSVGATSNTEGKFSKAFTIVGPKELKIIASKEGFLPDTVLAYAVVGRVTTAPTHKLEKSLVNQTTGNASSIYLSAISSEHIGVKESGSVETAFLTFEVQDSTGKPVDLAHSVTVSFSIGSGPGGNESIYPNSVKTDAKGKASVNIISGTKAGVLQIVAKFLQNSVTIKSQPVSLTIHGGLPDDAHFSIAPNNLNFPGYNIFGLTNKITCYVGDKYSNPVKPETAVYFSSTGGIIEGSALTDATGVGSVNLLSAEPRPTHSVYGKGFATITAKTVDENSQIISDECLVLFSGVPATLTVNPTVIDIPNGGSQSFDVVCADQNLNPLSKGQSVSVTSEGENIKVVGDVSVNIPDTQSPAWTHFSFSIQDMSDSLKIKPVTVTIKTTGPNGDNQITIKGITR